MTASTRGNDYLVVKCKLIALLIACAIFGAPALRAQERDDKTEPVKISGEALRYEHTCLQVIDENRQAIHSTLTFRVRITNVSRRSLIIYRYGPAYFDSRLGTSVADMPNRKFRFEQRPAIPNAPSRTFEEAAPTNEFRLLQPNDSFTYDPQVISFSGESLDGLYLQLKATTWFWEVEKAEQLRQRWARYGELFYQDVTVEPIQLTLNKSGAATPRCNTQ